MRFTKIDKKRMPMHYFTFYEMPIVKQGMNKMKIEERTKQQKHRSKSHKMGV